MSEMTKSQIIQSLYTIRAGLAQVSGKKGQSEKLSKKVNSLTEQRNKDEAELGYLKQRYI